MRAKSNGKSLDWAESGRKRSVPINGGTGQESGTGKRRAAAQELIPEDRIRSLVLLITEQIGVERFVRLIADTRAALNAHDIRGAERAARTCRSHRWREFIDQVLNAARTGSEAEAINTLLVAGLFAYESTLAHLYAYLEYEKEVHE